MCMSWLWLTNTMRVITYIRLVCIRSWIVPIRYWRRLLPRWLINSLRLLSSLIVPSLMHVVIVASIFYNIVVTTLIAKKVRIHDGK
ncbi:hypothetical protein AHAS_Ahas19G0181300 [Arachis hypogaea]